PFHRPSSSARACCKNAIAAVLSAGSKTIFICWRRPSSSRMEKSTAWSTFWVKQFRRLSRAYEISSTDFQKRISEPPPYDSDGSEHQHVLIPDQHIMDAVAATRKPAVDAGVGDARDHTASDLAGEHHADFVSREDTRYSG